MMIPVTLISLLLTDLGIIPYTTRFTKYLNPLNWSGFFALGKLIQGQELGPELFKKLRWKAIIVCLLSMAVMAIRQSFSYFSVESALFEVSAALLLFDVSYALSRSKMGRRIAGFGKDTFCIYLIHIQIVQMIGTRLPDNLLFALLKPIIGLIVMFVLTSVIRRIAAQSRVAKTGLTLIGLR